MTERIKVSYSDYNKIKRLANNAEIVNAIKLLRNITGCGLMEGKHAVDHLLGRNPNPCARLVKPWQVESIIVKNDLGQRVEVSISELELKFLQESSVIGIDAVADLLDLTEFLKKWQLSNG
jgi:hypothetical protein